LTSSNILQVNQAILGIHGVDVQFAGIKFLESLVCNTSFYFIEIVPFPFIVTAVKDTSFIYLLNIYRYLSFLLLLQVLWAFQGNFMSSVGDPLSGTT
jgi:hypothetical protein